ncbi:hypothetical protein [Streptomyces sp. MZ04]|uniref:hypothetical protein n=1 Tax=Streptomyces sp. MZ04 TaxID=2559236 RepID=UPI0014330335|nr:hypothetical protein [Streptomyces sp. MZ04]
MRVPEYVRAGVDPAVLKASITSLETELAELRKQHEFARQWLEAYTDRERRAHHLVDIAINAEERLKSLTLEERKEVVDMFDVKVVIGDATILGKPGGRCAVTEWHWTTGTKVPPNPDDEQWPEVMKTLDANTTGVDAYKRPTLPPLTVTGELRESEGAAPPAFAPRPS